MSLTILNYTQHIESLSESADFIVPTQLQCIFYLTNNPVRNKQNKPGNSVFSYVGARVCVCLYVRRCVHASMCRRAFECSGNSGVWILSGCLSDRKASCVEPRGRQHQSGLCLISAARHNSSNPEVHIVTKYSGPACTDAKRLLV